MSKETTQWARFEPQTSRSGMRGVNHSATRTSTKWTIILSSSCWFCGSFFFLYSSIVVWYITVYSSPLQDLEQKQQELDALTTRIQNLEDVSTFPNLKWRVNNLLIQHCVPLYMLLVNICAKSLPFSWSIITCNFCIKCITGSVQLSHQARSSHTVWKTEWTWRKETEFSWWDGEGK